MAESKVLCFVFVCQAGELEIKAGLLAASLRIRLGESPDLVAAVPVPGGRWGDPHPGTKALLEELAVRLVEIRNRISSGVHLLPSSLQTPARVSVRPASTVTVPARRKAAGGKALYARPSRRQIAFTYTPSERRLSSRHPLRKRYKRPCLDALSVVGSRPTHPLCGQLSYP
jgi:hypothetical protein